MIRLVTSLRDGDSIASMLRGAAIRAERDRRAAAEAERAAAEEARRGAVPAEVLYQQRLEKRLAERQANLDALVSASQSGAALRTDPFQRI